MLSADEPRAGHSAPQPLTSGSGDPVVRTMDVQREIRLAVVMYGGVSLAIYMNGVAQELYHLVRATAPRSLQGGTESEQPLLEDLELKSTEHVYRRLGRALAAVADERTPSGTRLQPGPRITTRFVVDILSGTSAGGVNAIFLAKALANNQPVEQLKKLWMEQGNIELLLNDEKSRERGLTLEQPPDSLLNSGRMYYELLKAFTTMERARPNASSTSTSPFVRELDLWVTTTDLRGVTLPLKLANGLAYERRYRNAWHFVYGTVDASGSDRNDFGGRDDPMLAFAARSTSAFPLAFKPMLFRDMAEALKACGGYGQQKVTSTARRPWAGFYGDYFPPPSGDPKFPDPEQQVPFTDRPFADGGALDNKPFTWATKSILRRRADVPIDRKLIFIEPDPGHPESEETKTRRPNALENFFLQGNSLPRQETIREDIQALLERNRTIVRIDRVLQGIASTVLERAVPAATAGPAGQPGREWARQWLVPAPDAEVAEDDAQPPTPGESGYFRLKVATVTDDLKELIATAAGFDDESDELLALGYLVREWRDEHYAYRKAAGKRSHNEFLLRYDFQHRLRRLMFLRRRINDLYSLNDFARGVIQGVTGRAPESFDQTETREEFRKGLREIKTKLSAILVRLRTLGRSLRSNSSAFAESLQSLGITREQLRRILAEPTERGRKLRAAGMFASRPAQFADVADQLATYIAGDVAEGTPNQIGYGTLQAANDLHAALDGDAVAALVLRAYFERFDEFDIVAFPMLYGTEAGETDVVEVIRIAPEDATSILDERANGFTRRKTHGWKYNHFGAFLSPEWRTNDILFGRLDAAECLINALVPESYADRESLRQQAQAAIILDSLSSEERVAILGAGADGRSDEDLINECSGQLFKWFKSDFEANFEARQSLPPGTALPILARGIDVSSKVLDGIAGEAGALKRVTGWMARVGSLFARIVALGIPQSGYGAVFRKLFPLLLVLEAIIIGLAVTVNAGDVIRVGILAVS